MEDTFVIETIKLAFEMEILNKVVFSGNEIIVTLADDTRVKITTKNVA